MGKLRIALRLDIRRTGVVGEASQSHGIDTPGDD